MGTWEFVRSWGIFHVAGIWSVHWAVKAAVLHVGCAIAGLLED